MAAAVPPLATIDLSFDRRGAIFALSCTNSEEARYDEKRPPSWVTGRR